MPKLLFVLFILVFGFNQAAAQKRIAVTIDDLPVVATKTDIKTRRLITRKIVRHLVRDRVPAIGFVNENKLYTNDKRDEAQVDLLRVWTAAGLDLGNHTFSHMGLHDNPLEAFKEEIVRGEIITKELLAERGGKIRYFRHPYLWTGLSLEIKRDLGSFLAERGYTIAPVTVDNADWIFARAYDLAFDADDRKTMKRIGDAYVPYLVAKLDYFERQSIKTIGREIDQILLIHANRINSDYLDDLLKAMKKRGYRFVSLGDALQDPAYKLPDNFVKRNGISWLHRWALDKGRDNLVPDEPKVPEFVLKLSGFGSE